VDTPDVMIDFMRADLSGHISVQADKLPEGTRVQSYVTVGDVDAEPAVAHVLEVRDGRATLRILAGTVEDNRDLLSHGPLSNSA